MSAFGNVQQATDVAAPTDNLGDGNYTDPTGVYPVVVKAIRLFDSTFGGKSAEVIYMVNGNERKQTLTYANEKGENFNTFDGKKTLKPEWVILSDILSLGAGITMDQATLVQKTMNIYNFDAKKAIPTKVDVVEQSMGINVELAIIKSVKPKKKMVGNEWFDLPVTRELNEIKKVLNTDGFTAVEMVAKLEAPEFKDKWQAKFDAGYVKVYEAKNPLPGESAAASPAAGTPAPAPNGNDDLSDL